MGRTSLGYALENDSLKVWRGGGVEEVSELEKKTAHWGGPSFKKQENELHNTLKWDSYKYHIDICIFRNTATSQKTPKLNRNSMHKRPRHFLIKSIYWILPNIPLICNQNIVCHFKVCTCRISFSSLSMWSFNVIVNSFLYSVSLGYFFVYLPTTMRCKTNNFPWSWKNLENLHLRWRKYIGPQRLRTQKYPGQHCSIYRKLYHYIYKKLPTTPTWTMHCWI